jgi:hypothetical protein
VRPSGATWDDALGEFLLPYDRIRQDGASDERLLEFLESTYAAAADLGRWGSRRLGAARRLD